MLKEITVAVVVIIAIGIGGAVFINEHSAPAVDTYVVGMVSYGGAHTEATEGLREGMQALGYSDGDTISYIDIDAGGSIEGVRAAVDIFLEEDVDAIYSITTPITQEVAKLVTDRPVVFNIVGDPVGSDIAEGWQSSGNNTTGCSNYVGQTGPKRLEILKDMLPGISTVLVLYDPENAFSQDAIVLLREAAESLEVVLVEEHVHSGEDVITFLQQIAPGEYDAFFHLGEAKVSGVADTIIPLLNETRLPSIAHAEGFARDGMLFSYGPSWHFLGMQCASVLQKVLTGTPPTTIPIQIPEKLDLLINLKTAGTLDIAIPSASLLQADEILE